MELLYFYSPTCRICDRQREILGQLQSDARLPYKAFNIITDLDKALGLGIRSAPALAIAYEGRALEILTGFQAAENIIARLAHWQTLTA